MSILSRLDILVKTRTSHEPCQTVLDPYPSQRWIVHTRLIASIPQDV